VIELETINHEAVRRAAKEIIELPVEERKKAIDYFERMEAKDE